VTAGLRQFLDGRAWTHAEEPGALFDHGVGWLRRRRVLLPGITVLVRLVVAVREAAAARMHTTLAAAATAVDPMLAGRLRASLTVPEGSRFSPDGVLASGADSGVGTGPGQGTGPGCGSGRLAGAGGGLFGGAGEPGRGPGRVNPFWPLGPTLHLAVAGGLLGRSSPLGPARERYAGAPWPAGSFSAAR